jgi:hypothetical protein
MTRQENILTPKGRLVRGDLYTMYPRDRNNKEGKKEYWFLLAIPKNGETHWNQTAWGKLMWEMGVLSFSKAAAENPNFSWKITDGDSTAPNNNGTRPCDLEGHAGHWVLRFASGYPIQLWNYDGSQPLEHVTEEPIYLGDYIQVYGNIKGNDSKQSPGLYVTPTMVSLQERGERIIIAASAAEVGFGQDPTTTATTLAPNPSVFSNPTVATTVHTRTDFVTGAPPVVTTNAPPPYPQILTGPEPVRIMTPKAAGYTYDQWRAMGYTDEMLVQQGIMLP